MRANNSDNDKPKTITFNKTKVEVELFTKDLKVVCCDFAGMSISTVYDQEGQPQCNICGTHFSRSNLSSCWIHPYGANI